MFYNNLSPILFSIGPIVVRYYGLMYVIGFLFCYFFIRFLIRRTGYDLSKEEYDELFLYSILALIIGARIFYVLVYNPLFYLNNPLEIFAIWHGGLSFHGGLLAIILVCYVYTKKHDKDFLAGADLVIVPIGIALALGRLGNFINGELYGRITTMPWGVKFKDTEGFRHPSQLYEAGKNILIFTILTALTFSKKKFPKGFMFWLFMTLYPLFRFFIEFFREPDEQLGFLFFNLTMGQLICIIMFAVSITMLSLTYINRAPTTKSSGKFPIHAKPHIKRHHKSL